MWEKAEAKHEPQKLASSGACALACVCEGFVCMLEMTRVKMCVRKR